jgi:hypothetical protein
VQHVIHSLAGGTQGLEIQQIGFPKINLPGNLPNMLAFSGLKIVEATHSVAAFEQRANQSRTDESGRAGHQIMCYSLKISTLNRNVRFSLHCNLRNKM